MSDLSCHEFDAIRMIQSEAHAIARSKGWWDEAKHPAVCIALMHSELSEMLEALRHGNGPSDHIPAFSGAEEEAADTIIRILDLAERERWDVAGAIEAKMAYNAGRAHKHGGKAF